MTALAIYIAAVALGLIPGKIAERKGYELSDWWLFGTLLFAVALPAALLMRPRGTPSTAAGR
jgi:hypothetical protein